tara:strand:- start:311 stop:595 length:285 start_codon:yes stop_codon:yes gene_type:complete
MAKQQFVLVSKQRFQQEVGRVVALARKVPPASQTPFYKATKVGPFGFEYGRDRLLYWAHRAGGNSYRGLFVQFFRRNGSAQMFNKVGKLKQYGW